MTRFELLEPGKSFQSVLHSLHFQKSKANQTNFMLYPFREALRIFNVGKYGGNDPIAKIFPDAVGAKGATFPSDLAHNSFKNCTIQLIRQI